MNQHLSSKVRRALFLFMAAAVAVAAAATAGTDADADGVADEFDDCPNTPAGALVDPAGRPLGDLDGDCDADMADYELFLLSITGPLPPLEQEICNDGLDNDDDQLADCADAEDCPVGAACGPQKHCSESQQCGCPAGLGDCDGIPENGCETLLNNNPVCSTADPEAISGDTGTDQFAASGSGEGWYPIRLTEDHDGDVYLSATVVLESAEGTNYDLFLRCASCGNQIVDSSTGEDAFDYVYPRWDDDFFGEDDSYNIIIEVRWVSGGCGDYTLTVYGNTNLDGYPNTCNP